MSNSQAAPVAGTVDQSSSPGVGAPQTHTEQPDHLQLRDLVAQEAMADWAMWMVVATAATFVITSIGTFLIWRQVRLTRQAVTDTAEATEAMREANRIAARANQLELRPYVRFGKMEVADVFAGSQPKFKVEVSHSGQSPAYKVRVKVAAWLMPPFVRDMKVPPQWNLGADERFSVAYMAPGHDGLLMQCYVNTRLTEAQAESIRLGGLFFLCVGLISYRDMWGKRHITTLKCISGVFATDGVLSTNQAQKGNSAN